MRIQPHILALAIACLTGCSQPGDAPSPNPSAADATTSREVATPGGPMIFIPAGEFQMGDAVGDDTQPVHKVSVSSFYMDKFDVTQAVYEKLTGKNPARHKGEQNPVERVRWREAIAFCNARSEAEHLRPCYELTSGSCDFAADGYRLPTEAEWEYACRGGTTTSYYFGDDARMLGSRAWFQSNSDHTSHPVGKWPANPWGLCDMAGNVWQWCNDWYQVDYYEHSPAEDPHGPAQGEKRSARGGAFSSKAENCTSAARNCDEPGYADACVASDDFGFRCVRRAKGKEK